MTPTYCQKCHAENRIAVINGPTCTHISNTGDSWFLQGWQRMPDSERHEFLRNTNRLPDVEEFD